MEYRPANDCPINDTTHLFISKLDEGDERTEAATALTVEPVEPGK
jgi:hypothetical protein